MSDNSVVETSVMNDQMPSQDEYIRLLECWLLLAQELNSTQAWGYDATTIEQLLLAARAQLNQATSVGEARFILLWQYRQWQYATQAEGSQ